LKEVSVDCVLNAKQNQFTVEKMNQTVVLKLADAQEMEYHVGDRPFTDACDYQQMCEYTCPGTTRTPTIWTTYDMYGSNVSQNLSELIRNLFKEHTSLSRDQIVRLINTKKQFSWEQIYQALGECVREKHKPILDGLGRPGTLVNHGMYYSFQPIEITDTTISILDRKRPVSMKLKSYHIQVDPKKKIVPLKAIVEDENTSPLMELQQQQQQPDSTTHVFSKLMAIYEKVFISLPPKLTISSSFYDVITSLKDVMLKVALKTHGEHLHDEEQLGSRLKIVDGSNEISWADEEMEWKSIGIPIVVEHFLDLSSLQDKCRIMEYCWKLSKNSNPNWTAVEKEICDEVNRYLKYRMFTYLHLTGSCVLLYSDKSGTNALYNFKDELLNSGNSFEQWEELSKDGLGTLIDVNEYYNRFENGPLKKEIRDLVGFVEKIEKDGTWILTFKTKQLKTKKKNTKGARTDQAGRRDLIDQLNFLFPQPFFNQNTSIYSKSQLVALLEMTMRYQNRLNVDSKITVLSPEEALSRNIQSMD